MGTFKKLATFKIKWENQMKKAMVFLFTKMMVLATELDNDTLEFWDLIDIENAQIGTLFSETSFTIITKNDKNIDFAASEETKPGALEEWKGHFATDENRCNHYFLFLFNLLVLKIKSSFRFTLDEWW